MSLKKEIVLTTGVRLTTRHFESFDPKQSLNVKCRSKSSMWAVDSMKKSRFLAIQRIRGRERFNGTWMLSTFLCECVLLSCAIKFLLKSFEDLQSMLFRVYRGTFARASFRRHDAIAHVPCDDRVDVRRVLVLNAFWSRLCWLLAAIIAHVSVLRFNEVCKRVRFEVHGSNTRSVVRQSSFRRKMVCFAWETQTFAKGWRARKGRLTRMNSLKMSSPFCLMKLNTSSVLLACEQNGSSQENFARARQASHYRMYWRGQ